MVSLSVMFAQRLACCMKFLRQFWSLVEIFLQHANAAKFEQIHRGCSQTMLKMLGFFWQHLLMTEWTPLLKLTARYGSLSFWVSRRSMLGRNVFFFFFVSAAVSCIKIYSEAWAEKKITWLTLKKGSGNTFLHHLLKVFTAVDVLSRHLFENGCSREIYRSPLFRR